MTHIQTFLSFFKVTEILYDETAEFLVQVDFDAYAFFNQVTTPTVKEVYNTMAQADYGRFLEDFLRAQSTGLFLEAVSVEYEGRIAF
mgnify:CR=1 FL=1